MHQENKRYPANSGSSSPRSYQQCSTYNTESTHTAGVSRPRPSPSREQDLLQKHRPTNFELKDRPGGGTRPRHTSAEILVTRCNGKTSIDPSTESRPKVVESQSGIYDPKRDNLENGPPPEDNREHSTLPLACWHFFMVLANIIMLMGGLSVFILGAWMVFDNTVTSRFIGVNLYLVIVYVLLGCGFFAVVLSVIGCVGAVKAARCLIFMYIILTVAVIMTMTIGAITIILCRKWAKQLIEDHMMNNLESYTFNSVIRDAWDATQQYLRCCGVHSSDDWPQGKIPGSCCDDNNCRSKEDVYKPGCLQETETYFDGHVLNIGAAFIGVQLVLLFGLIASCGYYKVLMRHR